MTQPSVLSRNLNDFAFIQTNITCQYFNEHNLGVNHKTKYIKHSHKSNQFEFNPSIMLKDNILGPVISVKYLVISNKRKM